MHRPGPCQWRAGQTMALRLLLLSCRVLIRVSACDVLARRSSISLFTSPLSIAFLTSSGTSAGASVVGNTCSVGTLADDRGCCSAGDGAIGEPSIGSMPVIPIIILVRFLAYSLSGISCLINSSSLPSAMAAAMRSASNAACSSGCSNLFFLPKAEFGGFGKWILFFCHMFCLPGSKQGLVRILTRSADC